MCPRFPQARRGLLDGYKLLVTEDGDALELHGVFVSALWPLDENEGAKGDTVLVVDVPDKTFEEYEHVSDGGTYREAMIPAAQLNGRAVRVLSEDELDELSAARRDFKTRVLEHFKDIDAAIFCEGFDATLRQLLLSERVRAL